MLGYFSGIRYHYNSTWYHYLVTLVLGITTWLSCSSRWSRLWERCKNRFPCLAWKTMRTRIRMMVIDQWLLNGQKPSVEQAIIMVMIRMMMTLMKMIIAKIRTATVDWLMIKIMMKMRMTMIDWWLFAGQKPSVEQASDEFAVAAPAIHLHRCSMILITMMMMSMMMIVLLMLMIVVVILITFLVHFWTLSPTGISFL